MQSCYVHASERVNNDSQIQPMFQLRFERSTSNTGRGQCLVELSLRNCGIIAASFPFLCLTNLGLNVNPAPGWVKEDIALVRRMLRFSSGDMYHSILEPGAVAHCCTVTLRYKFSFGGCLEFESGSEYLLANFPNLNLMCAVGAGNYPSKRILIQVPATAIRRIIEQPGENFVASPLDQPAISILAEENFLAGTIA
jgi:hypothetical protein